MKITFILPAIGKKKGKKYIGTWKMEPLTIALLKAMVPPHFKTEFFDDRIELIDYNTDSDIILITLETYTALRAYDIAAKFKTRGKTVIMGGYHATLCPDEVAEHSDSVIIGNAETVLSDVLSDAEKGALKKVYEGSDSYYADEKESHIKPDRSIFAGKKYLPMTLVETGRGCVHNCEFCSISSFYECKYIPRRHEDIIAELQESKHKYHFLVDDNLLANREHAVGLFKSMIPLNIKWAGQGTLAMAKDPELLCLMKASGCELILIGFESLNKASLLQMNKSWEISLGERDQLVDNIHKAGISIYATFVFGFDGDTKGTFNEALAFSKKHSFYTAAFNHLLPFPGTNTYKRLKTESRLIFDKWWLERSYKYGDLAFTPANMSDKEMSRLCRNTRKDFSRLSVVLKRGIKSFGRNSPAIWWLFWAMNLRLGKEIDQKMNVPLGGNLDELPK